MTQWRISSFSRAERRGSVASPHFGDLPFDVDQAAVDDFELGEAVLVDLDERQAPPRVLGIRPLHAHHPPSPMKVAAPPLLPEHALHAKGALAAFAYSTGAAFFVRLAEVTGWTRAVLERADRLGLTGVDARTPGPLQFHFGRVNARLVVHGPRYVDLATYLKTPHVRLATAGERDFLHAEKCALTEKLVAFVLQHQEFKPRAHDRFHFVVCERIECERTANDDPRAL